MFIKRHANFGLSPRTRYTFFLGVSILLLFLTFLFGKIVSHHSLFTSQRINGTSLLLTEESFQLSGGTRISFFPIISQKKSSSGYLRLLLMDDQEHLLAETKIPISDIKNNIPIHFDFSPSPFFSQLVHFHIAAHDFLPDAQIGFSLANQIENASFLDRKSTRLNSSHT